MRHSERWSERWCERWSERWIVGAAVLLLASLQLSACGQPASSGDSDSASKPAQVVQIAGTDISRVILTRDAANRLGIATSTVHNENIGGALRRVVPYSALLYDVAGNSWVYTNPAPLTYVRANIRVDYIA